MPNGSSLRLVSTSCQSFPCVVLDLGFVELLSTCVLEHFGLSSGIDRKVAVTLSMSNRITVILKQSKNFLNESQAVEIEPIGRRSQRSTVLGMVWNVLELRRPHFVGEEGLMFPQRIVTAVHAGYRLSSSVGLQACTFRASAFYDIYSGFPPMGRSVVYVLSSEECVGKTGTTRGASGMYLGRQTRAGTDK